MIVVNQPRFWQANGQIVVSDLSTENEKGGKGGISIALLSGEQLQIEILLCTATSAQQWKTNGGGNVAKAFVISTKLKASSHLVYKSNQLNWSTRLES